VAKSVTSRWDTVLKVAAALVAIALIGVYVYAVYVLAGHRGEASSGWDRLVYLFGGLETLVFAGAGVLFGASVQRAQVAQARTDAVEASEKAAAAERRTASSDQNLQQALKARADLDAKREEAWNEMVQVQRAKSELEARTTALLREVYAADARRTREAAGISADQALSDLVATAQKLFP